MSLEVACQHCQKRYLINARFSGKKVKCRNCNQAMRVEEVVAAGGGPEPTEELGDPLQNTLFEYRQPSEEDTKDSFDWQGPADWLPPQLTVCCHACGKSHHAPEELAGQRVRCRGCGNSLRVPEGESPTVTMEEIGQQY